MPFFIITPLPLLFSRHYAIISLMPLIAFRHFHFTPRHHDAAAFHFAIDY